MTSASSPAPRLRAIAICTLSIAVLGLAGCASFAGIGSDRQLAQPDSFATDRSLPAGQGAWPSTDWVKQFGDAQLSTLIDEAMAASPSLQQAQARIAAASALAESKGAPLLPSITAEADVTRNLFPKPRFIRPPMAAVGITKSELS